MGRRTYWFFGLALPLFVYACAEGGDGDDQEETFYGLDGGGKDGSSSATDTGTSVEVDSGGTPVDGGSTAKDSGANKDAGPATACTAKNKCATARDIGTVNGDKGNDMISAEGSASEWLTFRANEALTGIFNPGGHKMKFNATLVPPAGADFDLYIYMDDADDVVECSAVTVQSANVGNDEAGNSWGEGATANASNDSRTVSVEVRHKSGTCAAGAKWKLNIEGNPL